MSLQHATLCHADQPLQPVNTDPMDGGGAGGGGERDLWKDAPKAPAERALQSPEGLGEGGQAAQAVPASC